MNVGLWVVQGLLALFFALASAAPKLLLPPELLPPAPIPLPHAFVLFIGVAELLGALGLVLPGLLRTWPVLTPLAAAGLALVTVGATVYNLAAGELGAALFAVAVGLLCAFVAYGRWQMVPHGGGAARRTAQTSHEASSAGDGGAAAA